MTVQLIKPSLQYLTSYIGALKRGFSYNWSYSPARGSAAAAEELAALSSDPENWLTRVEGSDESVGPVILPDGRAVARLPGITRWLWDGDFAGGMSFRWQQGTVALPRHVMGHIGYAVVPWRQRRGYATTGLGLLLNEISCSGLPYVEITTDVENVPSCKAIIANGGVLVERFHKLQVYGGGKASRFRIMLKVPGDFEAG